MLPNPINWLSAATDPDRNIKKYSLGNSLSIWSGGVGGVKLFSERSRILFFLATLSIPKVM